MKTFLTLAVLSFAATVSTQAASSTFATELYRPKLSELTNEESGASRMPSRPKAGVITSDDVTTNRLPPRPRFVSVDGADLNRMPSRPKCSAIEGTNSSRLPSRPKFGETASDRMPHLTGADFVTAKSRPKVQNAAITTL